MQTQERSAVASLAAIMSFRLLGMFMILPVFSLYVNKLPHATPSLIGLALGIYGLTQACLQMPFGSLSDRLGRKPIIALGLILFALGSLIAALSHSITGIIIGRAIQGGGAIGSTILALIADLTRDEQRSKAMAFVGMSIGTSFAIAMIIGPLINGWWNLAGIFWVTMAMALLSLVILFLAVPKPPKLVVDDAIEPQSNQLFKVFKNPNLLRLDLGIFSTHAMLTATFIAIPILLNKVLHIPATEQALFYLPILVLAFIASFPFIIIGEKKRQLKPLLLIAVSILVITQLLLLPFHHSIVGVSILLFLFFTAFTLLEATLPSLVSKISPIRRKGTAMGIYSTSQFLGIFVGGSLGGVIFHHYSLPGVFIFCAILGAIWLLFAFRMQHPPYLSTLILQAPENLGLNDNQAINHLNNVSGVHEVAVMPQEGLIYFKVDKKIISQDELRKLVNQSTLGTC